ncbi:MAG: (d)CMP kinase [Puniceicoccales bacterium]|jgi:cytidylate kinase|nr:(d)CMP kinase [Puniceicoccales bacterium]
MSWPTLFFPLVLVALAIPFPVRGDFVFYENFKAMKDVQESEALRAALERPANCDAFVTVAIDGGAGSGKTSTARELARRHGFAFVSTGEHYRVLAYLLERLGVQPGDGPAIARAIAPLRPGTVFVGNQGHLSLDGRIFSEGELRSPAVNRSVARYAQLPELRRFLQDYQRTLPRVARSANFPGLVLEGRDMTSVVFPDASLRYFLTVDAEERVRRRREEGICDDVAGRDAQDRERLVCLDGVSPIDGTGRTLEEVVALLSRDVEELLR